MRVIYAEFAVPFWFRVAERLRSTYGIEPVAWSAVPTMKEEFAQRFPASLFLDLADVKRNVFPEALSHLRHAPFDAHCRRIWQDMAQLVYDQFHRWDRADDFTMLLRTEHFFEALVFWNGLLDHLQPDAVIFRNAPHAIYDLLLLGLARSRGIATVMFHHTSIIPYSIITADLDRGCNPFHEGLRMASWELEAGRKHSDVELDSKVLRQVAGIRRTYAEAVPWYQLSSIASLQEDWSWRRIRETVSSVWRTFRKDLKTWRKGRVKADESTVNRGSMTKERGRLLRDSYRGAFASTRYVISRVRERHAVLRLRGLYTSLAARHELPPPGSFVYVALSFQPEATTNPHGGIFAQQLLMVHSLASALPKGWTLVVREHPAQFNWDFVGQVCRNEEFYRLISILPRVRLAPLTADPFKLMDECRAVACLVGTTGWEATVRGKPALIFGDIWYDRAPGVFRVRGHEDCVVALGEIAAGRLPSQENLMDYVKELDFSGVSAGGDLEVAPPEAPTSDEQVSAMAAMVARVLGLPPKGIERVNLRSLIQD
jgi:hypothetical protein